MHVDLAFVTEYRCGVFDAVAIARWRASFAKVCADFEACLVAGVLWSPFYFASSFGGAPIAIVRQYIKQQQTLSLSGKRDNSGRYPSPP